MRGIVELVILKEIEAKLNGHIPVQNLFDLIVGTRLVMQLLIMQVC